MPLLSPAVNFDPKPSIGGGSITLVDGAALLAQEGPSGTAADIENQPPTSQISVYTVRSGDTLSGIAAMFQVSTNTIVWANDIQGGVIHPGETLIILPVTGIEHTVAKGETIAGLAKKYHSDAHDIAQYNELADTSSLTVGQTIIIPNGEVSAPAVAKSSGSSASQKIRGIARGTTTEPYLGGSGPAIAGYFAWPVDGGSITQGLHGWNAVDIGAHAGTNIFASAPGVVIIARSTGWNGGYGSYVVIQHSNGTETLYGHMSRVLVTPGTSVGRGDVIGRVGSTGLSTGSHLHFEVRGAANPFAGNLAGNE